MSAALEVSAPGVELARALTNALAHAGTDEARPTLACVRVEKLEGEALRFVGCDSYSLIVEELEGGIDWSATGTGSFMVNHADAKRIAQTAKAEKRGIVRLEFDGRDLSVAGYATSATYRLVEGEYPPYRRLLEDVRTDQPAPDFMALGAWNLAKFSKLRPPGFESTKRSGNPVVTFRPGTSNERSCEWAMGLTIRGALMPVRDVACPWAVAK